MSIITINNHTAGVAACRPSREQRSGAMKKTAMLFLLFAAVAAMAQTPKQSVAVYMAGTEPSAVKGAQKVLGAELAKALAKSGRYTAVDRTDEVIKVLSAAEIFGKDGAIDVDRAKRVGKQLGAQVVCVAEISEVMESYFLEARLVNVETAEVSNVGSMHGNMTGAEDVARISQAVAMDLLGGKRKIADYTFREIASNPDRAIKDYTEAIRQEPDVAEYYERRGYAYRSKKEYDIAIADYTEAIRLAPKETSSYFFRGLVYQEDKKDNDRAIADYNQVIRLNPDDAGAYNNLGNAYKDKGDYDRAFAGYNQAIQLSPNFALAYSNRGLAYADNGDYDRAFADYNQAIRLDPNLALAYNNRGLAYNDKKDYDRAIVDCNQAIRLDPNLVAAYYNRSRAYKSKGDYDRAIADNNQAIQLAPNDANAYNNRGNTYVDKGDYNQAFADYTQAIRLNPNLAGAYYNRGLAYKSKGDYDRAISDYNQAIQLAPNFAEAYKDRGNANYLKKDYNRAIADWESTLRINPNNTQARNNLEVVKEQFRVEKAAQAARASIGTFIDKRDGKVYKTVKIDNGQTWMAENLNYNAKGSVCYDNKNTNCAKYGRLYDWFTAMKACPTGTHLPSNAEWEELTDYVGGKVTAGEKLKSTSGWNENGNGTNDFVFSALPGGLGSSGDGSFSDAGNSGFWWSATAYDTDDAFLRIMFYDDDDAHSANGDKTDLMSVRCVADR
jgi:uncharacterized protein (TIGR02145 family)